ncbi:unnamed protein product, partial [marine sediment metagenome]
SHRNLNLSVKLSPESTSTIVPPGSEMTAGASTGVATIAIENTKAKASEMKTKPRFEPPVLIQCHLPHPDNKPVKEATLVLAD